MATHAERAPTSHDQDPVSEPIVVPLLEGPISVTAAHDSNVWVFEFPTHEKKLRIAIKAERLHELIITAAHAFSPNMLLAETENSIRALPAEQWKISNLGRDQLGFSFQMTERSTLNFVVPRKLALEGLAQALQTMAPKSPQRSESPS